MIGEIYVYRISWRLVIRIQFSNYSVVILLEEERARTERREICRYKCLTNRVDFSFCTKANERGWQRAPAAEPQRRTFEHGPDFLAFG